MNLIGHLRNSHFLVTVVNNLKLPQFIKALHQHFGVKLCFFCKGTFELTRNIKTLSKLLALKYNIFCTPCIRFIKYDKKKHVKSVLKAQCGALSDARNVILEHDAAAIKIPQKCINLRFSAAMHEKDLHVYKLIRALTSDSERGSVQPLRREHKHTPKPVTISGA